MNVIQNGKPTKTKTSQSLNRNSNAIVLDRVAKRLKIKDEQLRVDTAREINELALLLIDLRRAI